jgi:hypothetical protein
MAASRYWDVASHARWESQLLLISIAFFSEKTITALLFPDGYWHDIPAHCETTREKIAGLPTFRLAAGPHIFSNSSGPL